jgi:hypothetical protein
MVGLLVRTESNKASGSLVVLGGRVGSEHFPYLLSEIVGCVGLLQEWPTGLQQSPADYVIVGEARHVQDGDRGEPVGQRLTQLPAAHPRHDHIGDHQIDPSLLLLQEPDSFSGSGSFQAALSETSRGPHDECADRGLVFHDQQGFRAPLNRRQSGGLVPLAGN